MPPASDPRPAIAQNVLRRALAETAFAAASDEARPILTGVLARFEGDQLTLAAADNYRIAVKTIAILDPVPETSVVVPARALNELARILADVDDPVEVVLAAGKNQILFHLDGIDLVSRLIDGQFPNYQQVVPTSHTTRAVLDREELLRAVRPAALIAHESANIVKLQVSADGEPGITVSANAEVGDHVGQVEATVEGDGTTIAFNARYLADVLTNVAADQFALELNGPLSPGRLQADRRRPLHPRGHARADHVLATRTGGRPGRSTARTTLLDSIDLLDLRGYASLDATFGPGPHLVWGPNAAGKTSLLEAMVLLAWGRSHRTPADGELIRWGRDLARVEGVIGSDTDRGGDRPVRRRRSAGRKRIRVNGLGRRAAGLAGLLRVVLFAPEEMLLIAGSPSLRRAVIDQLATTGSPAYADALTTYGRTLQQRNSLLRAIREEGAAATELRFWDGAFLDAGAAIVAERRRLLEVIAEPLAAAHAEIAPGRGGDRAADARAT